MASRPEPRPIHEALRASGKYDRFILDAAGEGIYGLDSHGLTTFVNPAAARMLGYTVEELLGEPQHTAIHHSHADGSEYPPEECPIYATLRDGEVHHVTDDVFWRRDGSSFRTEFTSTPVHDDEGRLVGAVVLFQDVSERRKAEESLRALERQKDLILEAAGEGIYGLDSEGNTTFVNAAAARMLGWEPEPLMGKPQHAFIHHTRSDGQEYPREQCPIYAAFHDGEVHRVDDEVFWRRDGSSFPVEYTSTPMRNAAGELVGAVVVFQDITERKQAEESLREAYAEIARLRDQLQAENLYLQDEIKRSHNFEEIVGESEPLQKVLRNVEQVATTEATVLILGDSGTGKELVARAIHDHSARRKRPLVKVNCAALPANLIESELFGHEKGAFTGATAAKEGRFLLADKGTIFLDEIGDLPLELQAKLLRVLQEGEFERVGSSTTRKVDVRVIAATNRDLLKATWSGEFRQDLYYRLNVFPVNMPSLAERRDDVPLLVRYFLKKFCAKMGKCIDVIPADVMEELQAYPWPGNIRELENVIERAVILAQGDTLDIADSLDVLPDAPVTGNASGTLASIERDHIARTLEDAAWKIEGRDGAADRLGLKPSTLRSRMRKLGVEKPTR